MKPTPGPAWRRALRSVRLAALVLVGLVVYAYGFQVTKVDLEETRSPVRQTQLVRIIRRLAQPDILEYDEEETSVSSPFHMPCPSSPVQQREVDPTKTYILVRPSCVERGGTVQIEGFHLAPHAEANIFLVPSPGLNLRLGAARTDETGHFILDAQLPERESQEAQSISAVVTSTSGLPRFSRNAYETWDKIVETVFLALLATTLGTILAVPLSFFAARNLMKGVTNSMLGISLAILAAPLGLAIGSGVASWVASRAAAASASAWVSTAGAVLAPAIAWMVARWALPQSDLAPPTVRLRVTRGVALLFASLAVVVGFHFASEVLVLAGDALIGFLPHMTFLGSFVGDLGEILDILLSMLTGLAAAGVLVSLGGRLSRALSVRIPGVSLRWVEASISMLAGAALFAMLGATFRWLYQIGDPVATFLVPGGMGAVLGLALSLRYGGRDKLPIGLVIYYIARTVFNGLRAIEALIMVIVFTVWVGIGPFAGVLALSLHSIAAMAKLYSEQVESILPGPLEAITATGATRMQTIIYAVVPQIIPPYISFTMYRWDINVRMSTIIGFAGGGGIGFLLSQNINLTRYSQASAQILAIAVVVAAMDWLSSTLRERVV
jgi:phosphonate ABC transporter permease subunit PhnE